MQKDQLISIYQKKLASNQDCLLLVYKELFARASADITINDSCELERLDDGNYSILQEGAKFLLVVKKEAL